MKFKDLPVPRVTLRAELDQLEVEQLAVDIDRPVLTIELLKSRGIENEQLQKAMKPELSKIRQPTGMAGYQDLMNLLLEAKRDGLKIGVFGDYDVDGVTSATILSTFLEGCGYAVTVRVATRESGYGIGIADADALIADGAQVVLMADLGTSDTETLLHLREKGIRTGIMDHHVVPKDRPPVDAFINPHQEGCEFPFKGYAPRVCHSTSVLALRPCCAKRAMRHRTRVTCWT